MTIIRYVAIIKYTSGATAATIILAGSRAEAWEKLLKEHNAGENISAVELSEVIGDTVK